MSNYPDDGELSIEAGGVIVSGWQAIRLTRGVERCPSDFDIALTEKFPGQAHEVPIHEGQVARVRIGKDLVLSGFIDRYSPSITAEGHEVRVRGRSACEDVVDCSVHYRQGQFMLQSVRAIAEALCAPYGIKVRALAGDGPRIPQLVINLGETPYQVIERLARFAGFLVYDDVEGNLVLDQVGTESMGSGITEGQNVLDASFEGALDQRYSEYHAYMLSTDSFQDFSSPGATDGNLKAVVHDESMEALTRLDGKPRLREMAIISEQTDQNGSVATRRAEWEKVRRAGRSRAVRVTVDSWRDAKGKLWEPNYRVKVHLPHCKVDNLELVIGEVTYIRDGDGTRASMVLMPPGAYSPEPQSMLLYDRQMRDELDKAERVRSDDFGGLNGNLG